ncbi:hypothetical protein JL722_10217 [Aureococcus anophagefferens]|nr:hypothetical protein JL722_10217 [Aureococcus anophagefferens]
MGFFEMFALGLGVIAVGTTMALVWRTMNAIYRAIEHMSEDEDEERERREQEAEEERLAREAREAAGGEEQPKGRKGFSVAFWDFLIYMGFLATFTCVVYAERNADPYNTHLAFEDWFTGNEFEYNVPFQFLNLRHQVYSWLEGVMVPGVLPTAVDGSNRPLSGPETHFLADQQNFRIGRMRLRRVTVPGRSQITRFLRHGADADVVDLNATYAGAIAELRRLRDDEWLITPDTRALLTEFVVYNPGTDLFTLFRGLVEFMPAGTVIPSFNILSVSLAHTNRALTNDGVTTTSRVISLLEFALYGQVWCYILLETKRLCRGGLRAYCSSVWNVMTAVNLSIFVAVMSLRYDNTRWVSAKGGSSIVDYDAFPGDLAQQIVWYKFIDELNSFNSIMSYFRLFKYLRSHPGLAQLSDTISRSSIEMGPICIILGVVTIAFAAAFQLAFGSELFEYSDFPTAMRSMFRALLGDFDITTLIGPGRATTNALSGPFLCVMFIVVTAFVVLSMLLSIIDHAYEDVRDELIEKAGTDKVAQEFNEDFRYFVNFPFMLADRLVHRFIEKSAGGKVDFDKIKSREKVDPAMLMVLQFEKMTTGTAGDIDDDAGAEDRAAELAEDRKRERRARLLHAKATLTSALAALAEMRAAQDAVAKHLGAPDVASIAKDRRGSSESEGRVLFFSRRVDVYFIGSLSTRVHGVATSSPTPYKSTYKSDGLLYLQTSI